jgi:hypothetical protein
MVMMVVVVVMMVVVVVIHAYSTYFRLGHLRRLKYMSSANPHNNPVDKVRQREADMPRITQLVRAEAEIQAVQSVLPPPSLHCLDTVSSAALQELF